LGVSDCEQFYSKSQISSEKSHTTAIEIISVASDLLFNFRKKHNIMDNNKDLEEANKEVERSKTILHDSENSTNKTSDAPADENSDEPKEEGSGIFTADGKELPKIDGGYDIVDPGGTLGDDEFVSG
jgi:hypothetical protein